MGSAEGVPARRWKILGILRDALRTKSVGIIEELPEKGIVKYAKPAGVIAGLLPVTNPLVTMVNMAINAIKCKDAVIFSPHPLSRKTALEIARVLRAALKKQGAPEDLILCLEKPSIPLAQELMSICDLTIATGGTAMVQGGVQLRQAGLRRRRRQRDGRRRRDRRPRRRGDEHADQQDAEPRIRLLVRRQPAGRSDGLRPRSSSCCSRKAATSPAPRRSASSRRRCGTPTGAARIDTVARAAGVIADEGRLHAARRQVLHHREGRPDRQGAPLLGREAVAGAGHLQVQRLRQRCCRWSRRSSKSAARGTRSASRRSTTTTSTGWRRWRRSAASWCGSRTCAATPGRSPTACRRPPASAAAPGAATSPARTSASSTT